MLRQTQSAIVFVQQLGRGLRKAEGKDYLVVIDFIGNYANNFLIPIALFGDESLNKESLREKLNETDEAGVLPGLSSVQLRRDRAASGCFSSIASTKLDSMANLKTAHASDAEPRRRCPELWDFLRFESVDPVLLATKKAQLPPPCSSAPARWSASCRDADGALEPAVTRGLPSKRLHEVALLEPVPHPA